MQPARPVTLRMAILSIALLAAALACSLSGGNSKPAPRPTATVPPGFVTLTPLLIPSPTLPPSSTPVPTAGQVVATLTNCTPQSTWPVYTVVAGDTLGSIAQRTSSTVVQLAQANCLANAELIFVGQKLFVPLLPPSATPTPTRNPNLPIFGRSLTADPYWLDASSRAVTYSDTVRLNVGETLNATRVVFTVNDPTGGPAIQVGTDEDPWDGAFVDYSFPAAGSYTFQAVATNEVTQASSTAFTIRYDPAFVPPGGLPNQLSIAPYTKLEAGWYTLQRGATISVTWADAPAGALRVDLVLTPTGTNSADAAQIIGSDLNPADGVLITWSAVGGLSAHLQAVATMPDGSQQMSEMANIFSGT